MRIAGVAPMVKGGHRWPRPKNRHLSDGMWEMIERCWDNVPYQRPTITEVIAILEAELDH